MNYYEKNMDCIKQSSPTLYMELQEEKKEEILPLYVESILARDQNKIVDVEVDGVRYHLNSTYRPLEEAKRWGAQYQSKNLDVVFLMFGLGNGYFIREIISNLKKGDIIIVLEPSSVIFNHVLEEYDLTDILSDTRVHITLGEYSYVTFERTISRFVNWINAQSQIVAAHPQYDKIFKEKYCTFLKNIVDCNEAAFINRNTEVHFAQELVKNATENMKYINGSNYLLELRGKIPTNVPAIIVSAGPSLDKNIELLKQAKGKSIIIATDTALRSLHMRGIVPDFFVTLDPKKPVNYFDNTDYEDIPMFCSLESNPTIIKRHRAKKIWFTADVFVKTMYYKKNHQMSIYSSGGSVATAAFAICSSLRFSKIVFIGQDLAYDGEKTHAQAEGTIHGIQAEETGIRYVEGVYGQKVKTRHDWYIYLKWFEDAIVTAKEFATVIDATEGGALIHGSKVMRLQEVIDEYCNESLDITEVISQLQPTFSETDMQDNRQFLLQAEEDLQQMHKRAKQMYGLCEKIQKELRCNKESAAVARLARQMSRINKTIEKMPVYYLVENLIKEATSTDIQDLCLLEENEQMAADKTYESAKRIYLAMEQASKQIEPMIHDTINYF